MPRTTDVETTPMSGPFSRDPLKGPSADEGTDIDEISHPTHTALHASFDARQYRNALGRFASGITIVTTRDSDRTHGMTANSFISVSLNPPLILVSVDNRAAMNVILPVTRYFGVSVLAENQEALSDHFAGRVVKDLEIPFVDKHDVPVIEGAVAHFVARVTDVHPAGDHTLFIGHVEFFEIQDARPLLFHAGRYGYLRGEE
jgi:flavin reductase (DIM6/NTAB) family NADH-FMN oxidoreductase RutF